VNHDFKKLVPGRCLEHGVSHFMASFGIMSERGWLRFLRLGRARKDVENVSHRLLKQVRFEEESELESGFKRDPESKVR
jgi:hypothetical protein